MNHFQCQSSLFVLVSSCLFTSIISVAVQETFLNQSFHLNVTNCSERMKSLAPSLKELLEIDKCSRRQEVMMDFGSTDEDDASASDGVETVVLSDVHSLLINNTQLHELPNEPFCSLPNLTELYLRNNKFKDGDRLGFGSNCGPHSSCGLMIYVLALEGNHLTSIKANSFLCNLRGIRTLYLQNNAIEQIQVHAFANSSTLSHMYFTNNSLVSLARGTFFNLSDLWTLDLSFNKLKEFDCFREPDLLRLGNLDLNDNELEYLPQGVFDGLRNLIYMTIANNRISTVAEGAFRGLTKLPTLEMEHNNLTVLSEKSFSGLSGLMELELSYNQIEQIEIHSLDLFSNLTSLTLRSNRLRSLPRLMGMDKLESLKLQDNLLEVIANETFRNLMRLQSLDLSLNRIERLEDECFLNLDSLTHMNLNHNMLSYTEHLVTGFASFFSESATATFRHLIDLDLSHNRLTEFHFHIPFQFRSYSLKYLNVSHNNITRISINSHYEPILELVIIDMSYNSIAELVTGHVFLNNFQNYLEDVYCNNNEIRLVDPFYFQRMPKLRQVNLANNRLKTLYLQHTFTQKRERIVLALAGKDWSCDCNLEWVKEIISNPSPAYLVEDYDEMICLRQFHRFRDVSVPLRDTRNDTDFLCQFSPDDEHCANSHQPECRLACPESCLCYRSTDLRTIIVDCHDKNLTTVPHAVPKMTTVWYLDSNDIEQLEILPHLQSLNTLFVNHTGLMSVNAAAFTRVTSLQNLFMQNNRLTFLPEGLFDNLTDLRQLNLAYNQLSAPSVFLFLPLRAMGKLSLNDNRLSHFPIWDLDELTNLSSIGISDNPFSCDCYFVLQLTSWMSNASRKLVDNDKIYCWDLPGNYPIYLNNFDETLCFNATLSGLTRQQTVVLFSVMAITIVVVVIVVLIFIFRYEMQVLIYSRYGLRLFHRMDDEQDAGKLYDAFVSYSSLDEEFVIRELLPGLEGIREPYKLCLHHRDFPIGAFINESIFQAIDDSRRTIIVLSQNFVRSEWCRFEFRTAHAQMLQDRQNRVVVIIFGEIPTDDDIGPEMKLYLRTNTYLTWGDKLFWKKLYFVLPRKQPEEMGPFHAEAVVAEDVF